MSSVTTKTLSAFAISALLGIAAFNASAASADSKNSYGELVQPDAALTHIEVTSATKYVNIKNGDTVVFDVDGRSFGWHFNTLNSNATLSLSRIAPSDVHIGNVRVYVGTSNKGQG